MLLLNEKRMHDMVTLLQGSTSQSADDLSSLKRKFNSFVRISNLVSFFLFIGNQCDFFFKGNPCTGWH